MGGVTEQIQQPAWCALWDPGKDVSKTGHHLSEHRQGSAAKNHGTHRFGRSGIRSWFKAIPAFW